MRGIFTKDMEILKANVKTFAAVYVIALVCFLSTSAGPSFLISYVSILAAVMALNVIANDDMNNSMAFLFTLPVSRKSYVKEKYLLGAGMVTVLWLAAIIIAGVVNITGFRQVPWDELMISAAGGISIAIFAEVILFPVQLKYGSNAGRIVLFVLVFGTMAVGRLVLEVCDRFYIDLSFWEKLAHRVIELGAPVYLSGLFALLLIMLLLSCTISIKIMEKKEY